MIKYETLFKKTATGATQIWYMEQDKEKYRTTSGQIDGIKTTTDFTVCTGKNLGKKNETLPEDQAKLEIEAQYKKKLAQGNYKESIDDIDEDNFFKPMLANKYTEHPVTQYMLDNNLVYSQPKYDGARCIVNKNGMFSRQGKPIVSAPHIFNTVKHIFNEIPEFILDGELYNHQLKDNFNEIISLIRKSKPTKEDLEASENMIQYHVYDFPMTSKFSSRFEVGKTVLQRYSIRNPVHLVKTECVKSFEHLDELYGAYLLDGYEGQIIRIDKSGYENKRTNQLLKRKEFQDAEYNIVRIEEGLGNRSGMAGSIRYKLPDGREFSSGIKGGVDFYKQLLMETDSYIGGQGTVKFFQLTPDGIPRFPVTTAVYKNKRDI